MQMKLTPDAFWRIKTMLRNGFTQTAIAQAIGYSHSTVGKIEREEITGAPETPPSIEAILGPRKTTPGDPTPEEIAEACEKLRLHRPRRVVDHGWTAPVYSETAC